MAKVSFSKLGLTKNTAIKNIEFNGQNIEVKQYLPIDDKADLTTLVLNTVLANQDNRFANPMQIRLSTVLGIIEKYTNINFTDKQKEDPSKLYDLIVSSGLWDLILGAMDEGEYDEMLVNIDKAIASYYKYYNSIFGILDSINKDYNNVNLDASNIIKELADPDKVGFLKEVVTKLG